ncbi:MAG: hypothetical protein IPL73_13180 [Candidatus Obscuribacter sp.]|nr:hypothetical protein [Candidatus Obscuribacter sp.]
MPQALSQNLELALTYARQEAIGLESKSIQAEHLLLGLSRIAGDPAAEFLRENGLTLPFVMLAVDQVLQRQTAPDSLPLAALLEQVHNLSMLDSAPMCSTEHLLFVLLSQPSESFVGQVFECLGSNLTVSNGKQFILGYVVADEKVERLKAQISTWQSRAEMAHSMGFEDLAKQALEYKRKYERLLKITLDKKQEEQ